MCIYIAGKITGDKHYKKKFRKAERILKRKGHSVMSPAVLNAYPEFTWNDYMYVTKAMQKRCKATVFLHDWKESKGALIEYENAKKLNHAIFFSLDDIQNIKKR